jgi:hypothetical protein
MSLFNRLITDRKLVLALGLAALMTAAYADQQDLGKRIGDALTESNATKSQLATTMSSLNALQAAKVGDDLRPAYQTYGENVGKTKQVAAATKQRVDQMNADSATYFATWKADNDKIANAQLRKVATKRLEEVQKDYQKSVVSLQAASAKFHGYADRLGASRWREVGIATFVVIKV